MAEDDDAERMRALERRLSEARKVPATGKGMMRGLSQGEAAWRMVIELATGMAVGLGIGYGLDALFGTRPLLMVVFALLGFAAGVRVMLGTARQLAEAAKRAEEKAD